MNQYPYNDKIYHIVRICESCRKTYHFESHDIKNRYKHLEFIRKLNNQTGNYRLCDKCDTVVTLYC